MYTRLQKAKKTYSRKQFIEFHRQAKNSGHALKQCEKELITSLQQVYTTCTHSYFGYRSLYTYALKALDLTESQAYSYIAVAKAGLTCSPLNQALLNQELSVSKAARIVSVIDAENSAEWVEKAKTLTKRELEKQIATENPKARISDHFRHIDKDLLHMQAGISEECFRKFQRAQQLYLQKNPKAFKAKVDDILNWCLQELLERHDPVIKAERVLRKKRHKVQDQNDFSARAETRRSRSRIKTRSASEFDVKRPVTPDSSGKTTAKNHNKVGDKSKQIIQIDDRFEPSKKLDTNKDNTNQINREANTGGLHISNQQNQKFKPQKISARAEISQRKKLPAKTKHQVILRDRGQCQYLNKLGDRCLESTRIEIHHIRPLHLGGSDNLENLVTLCQEHHRCLHSKQA